MGEVVAAVAVESFWSMASVAVAGEDAQSFDTKFNYNRERCMQDRCSERFLIVAKKAVNFGVQSEFNIRVK